MKNTHLVTTLANGLICINAPCAPKPYIPTINGGMTMAYSKLMQILVNEHDIILSVLDAIEVMAGDESRPFNPRFYELACDFLATFADQCHHAKEEDLLFPALEDRGIPRENGPIGCMLHEHDDGRAHNRAIRSAIPKAASGDQASIAEIRSHAGDYAQMLRMHIMKENNVLFMMGDRVLTSADHESLTARFTEAEKTKLPPGTREKYTAIAQELRQIAGVTARQFAPAAQHIGS